jgi:hypothetical protein
MVLTLLVPLIVGSALVVPRGDVACPKDGAKGGAVLIGRVWPGKGVRLVDVDVDVSIASFDDERGFSASDVAERLPLSTDGVFVFQWPRAKGKVPSLFAITASLRDTDVHQSVFVRPGSCVEFRLLSPPR